MIQDHLSVGSNPTEGTMIKRIYLPEHLREVIRDWRLEYNCPPIWEILGWDKDDWEWYEYTGHQPNEICEECGKPLICDHCGQFMVHHDSFGIAWCPYSYWGKRYTPKELYIDVQVP